MVLILLVAACSSRYGTYLRITSDQKFDRIELYFGVHLDGDVAPTTPGHRISNTAAGDAYLAKRLLAETDVQRLGAPVQRFEYYLPDDDDNAKLGDVVVAVAYAGQTPVGIGELRDFQIVDNEVWIYKLPLHAYDGSAEVWGRPEADCVRWHDPELDETVAVVRGGDSDCDSYPDKEVDCDPLGYCDGHSQDPGCATGLRCLVKGGAADVTGPCAIGQCVNGDDLPANDAQQCTPELCVPEPACDCIDDKPVPEQIACALDSPTTHGVDYPISVRGGGALCREPYEVDITPPGNLDCTAPHVESSTPTPITDPEHFQFDVTAGAGGVCHLTIVPDMLGAKFQIHHLLISYNANLPRSTFIVGLAPGSVACEAPIVVMQNESGECPL